VNDSHGLNVVDVTDPAAPKVVDSDEARILIRMGVIPSNPQAVAIAGQNVLVTDGQWGMRVFSVSNPKYPLMGPVGSYDALPAP
jgi:hypothetical protein